MQPPYSIAEFTQNVNQTKLIHYANANLTADLTQLVSELGSDTTTHDTTIQTAPSGLIPGTGYSNAAAAPSRFMNDVILLINTGKAGGLTVPMMVGSLQSILGNAYAPEQVDRPFAYSPNANISIAHTGDVCTAHTGTWIGTPTSYTYAWMRGNVTGDVAISGATSASYTVQSADLGLEIYCIVTAVNATGSTASTASSKIRCS